MEKSSTETATEKDEIFNGLINCVSHCGWQLCPKCNGDGDLLRYNTPATIGDSRPICDLCNGRKIISIATGLPPIKIN